MPNENDETIKNDEVTTGTEVTDDTTESSGDNTGSTDTPKDDSTETVDDTTKTDTDVDTSNDVTKDMENNSYRIILGKIADSCWKKFGSKDDYVNTATGILGALKEIANGIRGKEPDEDTVEPRTYMEALISIDNALNGEDDDFSSNNVVEGSEGNPTKVIKKITDYIEDDKTSDKSSLVFFDDGCLIGTLNYYIPTKDDDEGTKEGYYIDFSLKEHNDEDVNSINYFLLDGKDNSTENSGALFNNAESEDDNVTSASVFLGNNKDVVKKKRIAFSIRNENNKEISATVFNFKNVKFVKETTDTNAEG